jgi:ribose transport system ATP-binding protein
MTSAALLELERISKTFPGQVALDNVSLRVMPGEVHGLVGHNGSGKSTLVKMLAGFHRPDPGARVVFEGAPLSLSDPVATLRRGLRFVHQNLALVDTLSVCENIALGPGFVTSRLGRLRWREQRSRTRRELAALGHELDPRVPVSSLSTAERTIVALARALDDAEGPAKLLVLDEVTATLPAGEAARVFAAVRAITAQGVGVVYISHHLDEVLDVSDNITVLRSGRRVGTFASNALDRNSLAQLMVGDQTADTGTRREDTALSDVASGATRRTARPSGQTASERGATVESGLEVRGLRGSVIDDIDLSVPRGFVLGVAGLTGSGREELSGLLFGRADRHGSVRVDGIAVVPRRPDRALAAGMSLVPADRTRGAIFATLDVRENMTISRLAAFWRAPMLSRRRETAHVKQWLRELLVDPAVHARPVGLLSGGMQQKVVLARALRIEPKVLVVDEPTQGIDVQTKVLIYERVRRAAAAGTAVLVVSSDSDDLCQVADEVIVLAQGKVSARVTAGPHLTPGRIDQLQLTAVSGLGA